jgi:hypothetical protein
MPFGRSYSKAKKAVSRYATRRVAKRVGKRVVGKFIPGYNVYSTARDIHWAGNRAYGMLKRNQLKMTDKAKTNSRISQDSPSMKRRRGSSRRYGIDDWF